MGVDALSYPRSTGSFVLSNHSKPRQDVVVVLCYQYALVRNARDYGLLPYSRVSSGCNWTGCCLRSRLERQSGNVLFARVADGTMAV